MQATDLGLTLLGFGMVVAFMALIMAKKLSPLVALTLIPVLFALVGGFGGHELGAMMIKGVVAIAPTGIMLMFAILYFGIMIDAGLFDPVVKVVLSIAGGDPLKVVMGTAILSTFVSFDGDGSTTYMIVVASMLPLYRRLRMNPLGLTCVTILASGVMNLTPWGGPLARAASALHVEPSEIFVPMIPAMGVGIIGVIALSYYLGLRERARLGVVTLPDDTGSAGATAVRQNGSGLAEAQGDDEQIEDTALLPDTDHALQLRRPKLIWVNAVLTIALMAGLLLELAPLPILFMVGFAVALLVNYPHLGQQRERVANHGKNVIAVVSLIFAAGVFTGILSGTGMVKAMSGSLLGVIPEAWGPMLAPITAIISLPSLFFISNDAFYFGVLPIVSEAAGHYGIAPVEMARAALIGQPVHLLSPLVPSTYLLVGLAGVEFGDHQRFTIKWAILISLLLMIVALVGGVFPLSS